jgi:3-(3-hydroxy-phenyl)propionate hydroxylase
VNDLLQWADGRLLVLAFGPLPQNAIGRLRQLALSAPVRCVQVLDGDSPPQVREHLIDHNANSAGQLRQGCQISPAKGPQQTAWAVVRPDGYLAATGSVLNGSLVQAIRTALGM